jgi:hypothetical protein
MDKVTIAYRAWRKAAERGYGKSPSVTMDKIERVDANVRRLKAAYEALAQKARR